MYELKIAPPSQNCVCVKCCAAGFLIVIKQPFNMLHEMMVFYFTKRKHCIHITGFWNLNTYLNSVQQTLRVLLNIRNWYYHQSGRGSPSAVSIFAINCWCKCYSTKLEHISQYHVYMIDRIIFCFFIV